MDPLCIICCRRKKLRSSAYCVVSSIEIEMMITVGYKLIHGTELAECLFNTRVHKVCYWKCCRIASKLNIIVTQYSGLEH